MVTTLPPVIVERPEAPRRGVVHSEQNEPQSQQPLSTEPAVRARFGSKEIITLEVRGTLFTNWTTVRVEQKVTEWFPTFVFECTEESPVPLKISAMQFVTGDVVRVYVGGVPAVFGYITERHVAYDAKQHGVRLVGVGKTFDLTNSSVPLEKLNGHDGQTWQQLADDITTHLGIKVKQQGQVDDKPFDQIQIQPGETIQTVLERYARPRNIVIGSDPYGALLAIGENQSVTTGDLIEGGNILRANAVIRDQNVYKKLFAIGQGYGNDNANGDAMNKQVAFLSGTSTRNRILVVVNDIAEQDTHGIHRRVKMEQVFTEGSKIEAQITVQGWFKDENRSDSVWRAGEYYYVNSPSLILDDVLGCAVCVYEQADQGSTTTLTLVKPQHMNGQFNFRDGEAAVSSADQLNRMVPSDL
ncbi:phage baseplate assembly protein [Bradyrhizobium sp. S3.9.1]|uniref:phage baseplate assembly protein n=1 Tax=Bradyrhizobium sp. S3.9.1 TaxID=3156431 RepID=UPI003392C946